MFKPPFDLTDFPRNRDHEASLLQLSTLLAFELTELFPGHPVSTPNEILENLRKFYQVNRPFVQLLSPAIINSTLIEIQQAKVRKYFRPPEIAYVIPVHRCNPALLRLTVESLRLQIGVNCRAIFVIDGDGCQDISALERALAAEGDGLVCEVIVKQENMGVARARNTGMARVEAEFFSWLDANDVIHPLRSLHAILSLTNSSVQRVNTSYARVNLSSKKLVIRNMSFSHVGHTSFVALSSLLSEYGYLADLRFHEDSEYQQRLEFFRVPMIEVDVVGHYLDVQFGVGSELHLSGDTWEAFEVIDGHSSLLGSYSAFGTQDRIALDTIYREKYEELRSQAFGMHFPCIE